VQRLLADPQCDVNVGNLARQTALHISVANWSTQLTELLANEARVNINLGDADGFTPFLIAARIGACEIAHILARRPELDTAVVDAEGQTLSHFAATHRTIDMIRFLRKLRLFNVRATDQSNRTPVDVARAIGRSEVVRYVLSLVDSPAEEEDDSHDEEEEDTTSDSEDSFPAPAAPIPARSRKAAVVQAPASTKKQTSKAHRPTLTHHKTAPGADSFVAQDPHPNEDDYSSEGTL
jgi:ankyrin repeat protein